MRNTARFHDRILRDRLRVTEDDIARFCDRWGIAEFALFGSVLRENFHPASDIDVLITYRSDCRLTWRKYMDAKTELEQMFSKSVDMVEKALIKNPYRRAEILRTSWVVHTDE